MARGFGTTRGSGTTDLLLTQYTAHSSTRSYAIWTNRNGEGGTGFGLMISKRVTAETEFLQNTSSSTYRFGRQFTSGQKTWEFTRPAANQWHHVGVSYDSSSTTNDAVLYLNGVSQSLTIAGAPTGSATTTTDKYSAGNRGVDSARNWDGDLAEFAIWDVLLSAEEFVALAAGVSPMLIRPQSRVWYEPILRDNTNPHGAAATITGTAIREHPRTLLPATGLVVPAAAAVAVNSRYYYDMMAA